MQLGTTHSLTCCQYISASSSCIFVVIEMPMLLLLLLSVISSVCIATVLCFCCVFDMFKQFVIFVRIDLSIDLIYIHFRQGCVKDIMTWVLTSDIDNCESDS